MTENRKVLIIKWLFFVTLVLAGGPNESRPVQSNSPGRQVANCHFQSCSGTAAKHQGEWTDAGGSPGSAELLDGFSCLSDVTLALLTARDLSLTGPGSGSGFIKGASDSRLNPD